MIDYIVSKLSTLDTWIKRTKVNQNMIFDMRQEMEYLKHRLCSLESTREHLIPSTEGYIKCSCIACTYGVKEESAGLCAPCITRGCDSGL